MTVDINNEAHHYKADKDNHVMIEQVEIDKDNIENDELINEDCGWIYIINYNVDYFNDDHVLIAEDLDPEKWQCGSHLLWIHRVTQCNILIVSVRCSPIYN